MRGERTGMEDGGESEVEGRGKRVRKGLGGFFFFKQKTAYEIGL